jgi:hypothetical protein
LLVIACDVDTLVSHCACCHNVRMISDFSSHSLLIDRALLAPSGKNKGERKLDHE